MPNFPHKGNPAPWRHKPPDEHTRALYHTHRWRQYRQRFLKVHPVCAQCEQPAQVVDHKTPARQRPELFWSASNHQSLCQRCHQSKRATED